MKTNTKISFLARTARLARATGARAAMTLLLLLVTTTTARAAVSGFVDIVWEHNGSIEVSGWTYDTEYVDTPIGVHVQIWDYYGNTLIKTVGFPANIHRDDVGNKGFHGFVPIENEGTYMVKIAAMGVSGSDYLISSSDAGNTFYATPGAPWIISYDANGGWNAPAPQTNHWGIPSSLSTVQPTRPGYTFTGWNTAADGTGEAHTSGYTYNFFYWQNNVTLYAQWTPTYTVTYNANGGSGAPAAQEKIHDIPLALSTALPSRVGYYFTGWNTAANGSGIAYSPGATYTGNAALTLYAQWTKTSVSYLAYNTGTKAYEILTANNWSEVTSTTMGAAGTETWYVVCSNATVSSSRIEVLGTVNLILADGCSLRAEKGIHVPSGVTLNIYGQGGNTGQLHSIATADAQAGIGGNSNEAVGTLTIHGGSIVATGNRYGAGIGGGEYSNGGIITIYGGMVNATGGQTGAGIGGGWRANCGTVTIIGGTVIAQAQTVYDGDNSQAIGSGAGTGISDGSLIIDNIKVYSSAEAANPVAHANRLSTCQSKYARLVPCTEHTWNNGTCNYCGTSSRHVTYDSNNATGGTVPTDANEYESGTTVTVLDNTGSLARTGYTFGGWNTKADGSGTDYAPGATFAISSSVTLYAKWTPITYTITYDLAGGTVATANPTSYTIESDAITLNKPTRDGYAFTGWTGTGLTEPTMTVTIPKGSTGNRTYTATWTFPVGSIDYVYSHNGSISFGGWAYEESNPSTPIPVQVQIWSGENLIKTVEFMANNPREDLGYNCGFTGVIPLNAGLYKVKIKAIGLNQVYLIWPGVGSDLYLQVGTPWTISYDANGGTGAPEPQTNHWAVPSTLSTVQPTRPGYTFTGWNTEPDGSGVPYPSGYTDIYYVWMSDRTLYAQWTLNTYTVAYNLAGGTVATDNPTSYNVESDAITLVNPTREGYTFTGWMGTGLAGPTMTVTIPAGSTGNRTYTATWFCYYAYNTTTGTFEEREASNPIIVTNSTTTMGAANNETWYVVNSNVNSWGRITVNGTVHLILADGTTLTASRGITVNSGNTLNIYGQTSGTGTLNATGVKVGGDGTESAAIGSTGSAGGTALGIITIHGGRITANGASWSAGIGGGIRGGGGLVAIYGGTVNATGHDGTSEAIGHGSSTEVAVSKSIAKGLRVTVNNSSSPVAYSSRVSALAKKVVKVEPCTAHNLSNNTCIYCGITCYGVTYDGNNATSGTVPTDATDYESGTTVTVLDNTGSLARTGYTFGGWNTKADGSGTDYAPGATFAISSSVTLYAQWSASLLTLANNADNSEAIGLASGDGMYYDVTLAGRTLYKNGDWNTLCLPFDLGNPEAEEGHYFDGTLLEGATVKTLGSTTFKNNILTMTFVPATTIEAGKPYIIKWAGGDNLVEPAITGVIIPATYTSAEAIANALHAAACKTEYVDFVGTFSTVALQAGDKTKLYLAAGNNLYYPDADMNINACRAYFQLNGITAGDPVGGEAPVRAFVLNFGEEETGIVEMRNEEGEMSNENEGMRNADAWYDMQGRRVNGQMVKSSNGKMKPGLYIHNGRKVVVE